VENHLAENPRHTVMLLLQGAVDKAGLAKVCHQSGAWVEKGFHLGRLTTIVDALRDRLQFTQDTPLAYDLEELYKYVDQCVQEAVYEKDTFYLDAALEILTELRDAWVEMLVSVGELQLDEQ
jgi:flagellar protein FliS